MEMLREIHFEWGVILTRLKMVADFAYCNGQDIDYIRSKVQSATTEVK